MSVRNWICLRLSELRQRRNRQTDLDRELQSHFLVKLFPIEEDRKGQIYVQQAKFKKGNVQFPERASFMPRVENELLSYPYGDTDDIVDSIRLALQHGGKGYDSTLSWV